jgi:DMSO/TMAO reductase YedYZ molybdopterin-dependent catalytic subunit
MSNSDKDRGICELYEEDPERADYLVFGRIAEKDRRGFLKGAGLATMAAVVGTTIPFHRTMPAGLIPAALADETSDFKLTGKDGLTVLNDRPINAETPVHLLNDDITPNDRLFVRNNGTVPEMAETMDAAGWSLTVDGDVDNPLTLGIDDLKSQFEVVKLQLQLECGGNGRAAFNPPAKGNQWTLGAVGNPEWTGVRYADVLKAAQVKSSAIYTAHYGMDGHLSGDPDKLPISRGVPIEKAMNPYSIIAFEMNGVPIPTLNGFPVRVVCPGWPGSCSQKWLRRIQLRDVVHDGPKMTGTSYRVPYYPVEPGEEVDKGDFQIIQSMPVKSIITSPETGFQVSDGRNLQVAGHAWAGDRSVDAMHVSIDFGATWHEADLKDPSNAYAWQHWSAELSFPEKGYYEVWARATDSEGVSQPFAIAWNPKGYLNNSMHRIAVRVTA